MPFQKLPELAPRVRLAQTAPGPDTGTAIKNSTNNQNAIPPTPPVPNGNVPLAPLNPGVPVAGSQAGSGGVPIAPGSIPAVPNPTTPTPATPGSAGSDTTGTEPPNRHFSLDAPGGVIEDAAQGLIFSQGPVTFAYGTDFIVHADRAVYDEKGHKAVLTGNVAVTVQGRKFNGKKIVFNTETGHWAVSQIDRIFQPEEFPYGTVLDPLYVSGAAVTGNYDRAAGDYSGVAGSNFKFTSCDRDHYYILSKRLDFYRDAKGAPDRLVLRHNGLYILGHKIVELPVYVIPLNDSVRSRNQFLQPTVGQNDVDGFFVRTLYDLDANEKHRDSLLLDALQKRGIGLGLQRELAGAGLLYIYGLTGNGGINGRELDTRIQRTWRITRALTSSINFQSTKNNSFGIGSATNGDFALNFNRPRIQSGLLLRYSNNASNGSTFRDFGATFQHAQDLGAGVHLDASTIFTNTQSSGVPATSTLDNIFSVARLNRGPVDATLRTELHHDLAGVNTYHGAYELERIPELLLQSSPERLHLPFLQRYLPGQLTLGVGAYAEPASQQTLMRTDFQYDAVPRPIQLLKSGSAESSLTTTEHFEQSYYSDAAERYDYNYGLQWNTGLFKHSAIFNHDQNQPFATPFSTTPEQAPVSSLLPLGSSNTTDRDHLLNFTVNYFKQRTVGYTPFQFDYLTPTETVAGTVSLQPNRVFRFGLSAGRDLQNSISNDILGTIEFAPSPSFYYSLNVNYSPQSGTYGDLVNYLHLTREPNKILGGSVDLGVRYSPTMHSITQVNADANIRLTHKTQLQALTSYNGFTKQFDFSQFRITQDLHCFNLYATFDTSRKEFRLDLALKAFPFLDTRLGVNQQGAGFSPQIGVMR